MKQFLQVMSMSGEKIQENIMSDFRKRKPTDNTILYGFVMIAVLLGILAVIFLTMIFQGYTRNLSQSRQAAAAAPVEDKALLKETGAEGYVLQDSSNRYLNEYDIAGWSVENIRLAKNEIYARHGRIFKDEYLDEYFRSKNWYCPSVEPEDFNVEVFNDYEKKNVEYLADAQLGLQGFTSDTFTYQDTLGDKSFAFKYPVNWGNKVMFRVNLTDYGMMISCVDLLNNKRGLSLYGDSFGTVFSFEVRQNEKETGKGEKLILSSDDFYAYLREPESINYLESEPDCVKSYENLQKDMVGVVRTFRIVE